MSQGIKAFVIVNASGEELEDYEHFEDANHRMREVPSAQQVLRRSDGALLSFRGKEMTLSKFVGAA